MKTTIFLLGLAVSSQAMASNYPPNYCHQVARVSHNGPALFAHVGSGCESLEILGYKASGMLAADNPEFVDAVIVATCGDTTKTSVLRLGREWHGKGYMSEPQSIYTYLPQGCYPTTNDRISIAFTANGEWDSRYGQNYPLPGFGSNSRNDEIVFETHQAGYGSVNLSAWDFIVREMDR